MPRSSPSRAAIVSIGNSGFSGTAVRVTRSEATRPRGPAVSSTVYRPGSIVANSLFEDLDVVFAADDDVGKVAALIQQAY